MPTMVTPSSPGGSPAWQAPRIDVLAELLQRAERGPSQPPDGDPHDIMIVSGMSGAGRTTATNVLEDMGWYVVDNLPPQLIPHLAELAERLRSEGRAIPQLAVACDVRSDALMGDLASALSHIKQDGWRPWLMFLEANDAELVRRFESVRRPHPVQGTGRLLDGIRTERKMLGALRAAADVVIDTSALNVHQLSAAISRLVKPSEDIPHVSVMSFGFKYGLPLDSDIVLDLRFLPNPYWVPELRAHNGTEQPVRDFVLSQPGAQDFIDRALEMFQPMVEGYRRENRRFVTLAIGCTGGKHRSVAVTEEIARRLQEQELSAVSLHRDLGRE